MWVKIEYSKLSSVTGVQRLYSQCNNRPTLTYFIYTYIDILIFMHTYFQQGPTTVRLAFIPDVVITLEILFTCRLTLYLHTRVAQVSVQYYRNQEKIN